MNFKDLQTRLGIDKENWNPSENTSDMKQVLIFIDSFQLWKPLFRKIGCSDMDKNKVLDGTGFQNADVWVGVMEMMVFHAEAFCEALLEVLKEREKE